MWGGDTPLAQRWSGGEGKNIEVCVYIHVHYRDGKTREIERERERGREGEGGGERARARGSDFVHHHSLSFCLTREIMTVPKNDQLKEFSLF